MINDNKDIHIIPYPDLPDAVIKAYNEHNLVVFIGAGISRIMGCMGWNQMANELIHGVCTPIQANQILNSDLDSKAKITIAKRISEAEGKEKIFWEVFKEAITPKKDSDISIYKSIVNLHCTFITTNCDGMLVDYFPNTFTTNCTVKALEENEDRDYLYCIHGNYGKGEKAELETLVFTIDKYLEKYSSGSNLALFLEKVMGKKTVLFLGYGLNEFEIISKAFERDECIRIKHYLLKGFFTYEKELASAEAEYYASQGVQLIAYSKDQKDYLQQVDIIEKWIDQLYRESYYAGLGAQEITEAILSYCPQNVDIVRNHLMRDDKARTINMKTVLESIPSSKDAVKWIVFLIKENYISVEGLKRIKKDSDLLKNEMILSLNCIQKCRYKSMNSDEKRILDGFIKNCLEIVNSRKTLCEIIIVVSLMGQLIISYELYGYKGSWKILKKWIEGNYDQCVFALEENLSSIKTLDKKTQKTLLSLPYCFSKQERNTEKIYWIEHLTKRLSTEIEGEIICAIATVLAMSINTVGNEHIIFNSLDDRLSFSTMGFEKALVNSLRILIKKINYIEREKLLAKMIGVANTALGYQVALRLSSDNKYKDIEAFRTNPLLNKSVFVEFFYWLSSIAQQLDASEINTIIEWIEEADYGYVKTDDTERNNSIENTISTNNYQLLGVLSEYDAQALLLQKRYEGNASIEKPTPIEDKDYYYAIRSLEPERLLPDEDFEGCDGEKLFEIVEESSEKSIWKETEFIRIDIQNNLFERITDRQFMDYIDECFRHSDRKSYSSINGISINDVVRRGDKTFFQRLINNLIILSKSKDLNEEEKNTIAYIIIELTSTIDSPKWEPEEVFDLAVSIDIEELLPTETVYNTDWDVATNMINAKESLLYGTVIKNAAKCSGNRIKEYKRWHNKQTTGSRKKWFHYTCAYYYPFLSAIDEKWAEEKVMKPLRKVDYSAELGIIMCSGASYVTKAVASFVTEDNRLRQMIKILNDNNQIEYTRKKTIAYITAAYTFGYIVDDDYYSLLECLNSDMISDVFRAICRDIRTDDEERIRKVLKNTYTELKQIKGNDIKTQFLEEIWKQDNILSYDWELISDAIEKIAIDKGVWRSIEGSLKHTKRGNKKINEVISKLVMEETTEISDADRYIFDQLIAELSRLKLYSSIKDVANYLVKNNCLPSKYNKYVNNPESAPVDFTLI